MKPTKAQARFYTAKEVVEILEKAKALGVITLKLQGFEAGWNVQDEPAEETEEARELDPRPAAQMDDHRAHRREERQSRNAPICNKCGHTKSEGQWGPFCRPCYEERKERNQSRFRTWR